MIRIAAVVTVVSAFVVLPLPLQAEQRAAQRIVTTIDMETFSERCVGSGGVVSASAGGLAQDCTLPNGAAVRCAPEAVGALICSVLVERRGKSMSAAFIARMPDGTPAPRLYSQMH